MSSMQVLQIKKDLDYSQTKSDYFESLSSETGSFVTLAKQLARVY